MKKLIALVIVIALVLSLTACSSGKSNASSDVSQPTSSQTDSSNLDSDSQTNSTIESNTEKTKDANLENNNQNNKPTNSQGDTKPDNVSPTITASKNNIYLNSSSDVVYITISNDCTIEYDIKDNDIVSCEWGDWDGYTTSLMFYPISSGQTSVKISIEGYNKSLTIKVTVELPESAVTNNHKHKYTTRITKPTCIEGGYTTYTCECGDSYKSDYTNAKGHTEVIDPAVEATLTSTGLTEGKHCSVCNAVLLKQETIPKLQPSPTENTKLIIEGLGSTYSYYLPSGKQSSTLIHSGDYKIATIGTTYIEIQIDLIVESIYGSRIDFAIELHDSNGVCIKTSSVRKTATKGTKYNIHMGFSVPETGVYTLKFFDIKP